MAISEILKKYNTDKNKEHHYGLAYDEIFSQFDRNAQLNILEIGTQKGESLLAWKEFFPNSRITGIDIIDLVPNKNPDINYVICDINDYRTDEEFDIVIDDGSHWLKDLIHAVAYFTPKLKPNGVMIIEDVQRPGQDIYVPAIANITSPHMPYNKFKYEIGIYDMRAGNSYDDFLIAIKNYDRIKKTRRRV